MMQQDLNAADDTLRVEMAAATDVGQIRERNEDALRIFPDAGVAVLSDGMGGHNAGNVASHMAVEIIASELVTDAGDRPLTEDSLVDALASANESIRAVARSQPECHGMGATVVVAAFLGHRLLAAHLGDSRLYRYWNDQLQQLTEDHTLAQQYVNQGVIGAREAKNWVGRNMLVRGLGIDRKVKPGLTEATLQHGQVYLLCSDGLTDAVSDEEIARVLQNEQESVEDIVEQLIRRANANGGPDNISVIVARVFGQR